MLSMVAKRGTDLTFACVKDCQVCVRSIEKYINTLTITEDDFGKIISELFKRDYHYFPGNSFVKNIFQIGEITCNAVYGRMVVCRMPNS